MAAYTGPKIGGKVTPQSLYRGFAASNLIGPYISQLFIQPFSYGVMPFIGYKTLPIGIDAGSWLNIKTARLPSTCTQQSQSDAQVSAQRAISRSQFTPTCRT